MQNLRKQLGTFVVCFIGQCGNRGEQLLFMGDKIRKENCELANKVAKWTQRANNHPPKMAFCCIFISWLQSPPSNLYHD